LRGAEALRLFALVLLFVLETLLPLFSNATPFFFNPAERPERVRRSSFFKCVSDTPKILAVSSTVGNGPLMIARLAFM
jgi:hypothetical protein